MNKNVRRSDYDVTNNIQVTSTQAVAYGVQEIFRSMFPSADVTPLLRAFEDFERLFDGEFTGYLACDTFYHDKQHTLDMTLALARLIEGYQQISSPEERLDASYTTIGLITALYHDAGYIREEHDENSNGAVYTKTHVTRSANFLASYLPMIGLADFVNIATNVVHYTGYEVKPDNIILPEQKLHTLGYMLGSADLIAQMSDRCYLEKCRDRLYPEFVLGNIAEIEQPDGTKKVIYHSGKDLLIKTPHFYQKEIQGRLKNLFRGVYQYARHHFGSRNLYIEALEANQNYLNELLKTEKLDDLSRIPLKNNGVIFADNASAEEIRKLKIK